MREHFHRTPAPILRNGIPMPPKWMLIGSELLAIDDAQVVSVDHEEKGRIIVRLVGADGGYERFGSPDRKPGEVPDPQSLGIERGSVRFWMTMMTAREILVAVTSRIQADAYLAPAEPREPISPEFDVTQVAGFELAHVAQNDLQYVFLRALDAPYSMRIELSPAASVRLVTDLREAISTMSLKEQEAHTVVLQSVVEIGSKPEVGPVAPPATSKAKKVPALSDRLATLLSRAGHKLLNRFGL